MNHPRPDQYPEQPAEREMYDPITQEHPPVKRDSPLVAYLKRMGAGSLGISVAFHVIAIIITLFIIFAPKGKEVREEIDFLPGGGGGGGSEGITKLKHKRQSMVAAQPQLTRVAANVTTSNLVIPDTTANVNQMAAMSNMGPMGGSAGKGIGEGGGKGSGKGMGEGSGWGNGKGAGFAARFMGMEGLGNNVFFVIDVSTSMAGNCKTEGIMAIRQELEKAINALNPGAEFNILCFGHMGDLFSEKSVHATADNKRAAIDFFQGYYGNGTFKRTRTEQFGSAGKDDVGITYVPIVPESVKGLEGTTGGSRMDLGLVIAFQKGASNVFLLSDGEPGTSRGGNTMDKDDLIKFIAEKEKEYTKGKVSVNTISVNKEAEGFLKKVSSKFRGKHRSVDPAVDIK